MIENKQSNIFLIILLLAILLSASLTYYRYMIKKNFTYFTDENSIPDKFDINSYK
ncbi:MAG: hypothetical protein NTU76_02545 [Candidatus Taylorbacteria bacterium]|nr:hypothetical protein [Candidatus Taylorbacteria bacterium]